MTLNPPPRSTLVSHRSGGDPHSLGLHRPRSLRPFRRLGLPTASRHQWQALKKRGPNDAIDDRLVGGSNALPSLQVDRESEDPWQARGLHYPNDDAPVRRAAARPTAPQRVPG